jgi:hypothetical protein
MMKTYKHYIYIYIIFISHLSVFTIEHKLDSNHRIILTYRFVTDRTTPTPPIGPGTISLSIRNPQSPPSPNLGRSGHSGFRRHHSGTLSPSPSLRFPPPPPPHPVFNADPGSTSPGAIRRAQEMHPPRRVRHQGTPPDALTVTQSSDPHRHTPSEPPSRDAPQRPLYALHCWYATSDALHVVSMDIIRS